MVRAPDPTWRDRLRRLVERPRALPRVDPPESVRRGMQSLRSDAVGPLELSSMARGMPDLVVGTISLPGVAETDDLVAQAWAFVDRHKAVFGLSDVSQELRHRGTIRAGPLGPMVEFDQVWREVPAKGRLKVNFASGDRTVRSVSNGITPVEPGTSAEPAVSRHWAVAAARRYALLTLRPLAPAGEPRLVVATDLARGFWSGFLAWEIRLGTALYDVDATTGQPRFSRPALIN